MRDRRSYAYAQLQQHDQQQHNDEPLPMQFDACGRPLNPFGRTGMAGRGLLGKWGPNYAADPIVTRWAIVDADNDECGSSSDGKNERRVLQMVAIQRRDTGEWAIPGGMVDAGEEVSATLRREFEEEAANCDCDCGDDMSDSDDDSGSSSDSNSNSASGSSGSSGSAGGQLQMRALLSELFDARRGHVRRVYRGYVDDPRNTDHAWMETTAVHFHCDGVLGARLGRLGLRAGDDAAAVRWVEVREGNPVFDGLYASHKQMVLAAAAGLCDAHDAQAQAY
jgi:ADP-ribose pyrophosphatase